MFLYVYHTYRTKRFSRFSRDNEIPFRWYWRSSACSFVKKQLHVVNDEGLTLDKRLTWSEHIIEKRIQLNSRRKSLYMILGKNSKICLKNQLLLYKSLLKPIWSYAIQLWGAAKTTNINKIQTFQSVTLRMITNEPFYISNHTLHSDLNSQSIQEVTKSTYKYFHFRPTNRLNPIIFIIRNKSMLRSRNKWSAGSGHGRM